MDTPALFEALPATTRIPASPQRVVLLLRSTTYEGVALNGPMVRVRANLVALYTLRGTFVLYAFFEPQGQSGGILYGSSRAEAPIAAFRKVEDEAREWLQAFGFTLKTVDLGKLDATQRAATLAFLPFAHPGLGDITQGTSAFEAPTAALPSRPDSLQRVLGERPLDAVRALRSFMIAG